MAAGPPDPGQLILQLVQAIQQTRPAASPLVTNTLGSTSSEPNRTFTVQSEQNRMFTTQSSRSVIDEHRQLFNRPRFTARRRMQSGQNSGNTFSS